MNKKTNKRTHTLDKMCSHRNNDMIMRIIIRQLYIIS